MENHHFQWVNPLCLWSFSIANREITNYYQFIVDLPIVSWYFPEISPFFSHPWGRRRLGGPESLAVLQPHRDGDVAAGRCLGKEFAQLPQRRETLGRCYPQSDGLYMYVMYIYIYIYIYICDGYNYIYICLLLFILILHETSENNMDDLGVPIF